MLNKLGHSYHSVSRALHRPPSYIFHMHRDRHRRGEVDAASGQNTGLGLMVT